MKGKLLFTVLLAASIMMLSCSSTGTQETTTATKSFFWEVPSEQGTVYILGSIHAADSELYPLSESIENAFLESDNVAVEFDVTSIDEVEILNLTMQKAQYPKGENLFSNIPEELYHQADELLEEFGADIILFNSFEPWLVAMEIEAIQMLNYGYFPENGIDMYFLNLSHEKGKEIYDLESADYQINLLDGLPVELQISMLESVVEEPVTKEDYEKLFTIWEEGDVEEMEKLVFDNSKDNPEMELFNEKLLDERNFRMVEKIEDFLSDNETYFVVVGAAHLVGENGIISLLKNKGYQPVQL